ncbi:hypothetical protein [Caryophanon latum]|uniref:Uncharacterized protein n=1 Tax=Caryophanon latum TaxID=33977 RepID=A0A1C0YT50_9BACL|nr:hypothetical protein [Caryophanon latum]OCS90330.1 hypothetical protein A6K76_12050 [Caryophanon latum]
MSQLSYVRYMNAMHMLIENERRELVSDLTLYLERLAIREQNIVYRLIAYNAEANYYFRYGEMIHSQNMEELLHFDANSLPPDNRWMIYRIRLLYLLQHQRYDELQTEALRYIRYAQKKTRYSSRCLAEGYRMLAIKHLACKNYDTAYECAQLQSHYMQSDDIATKNDHVCAKLLLLEASIEAKKQPRILTLLQELQMPPLMEGLTREYHQFLLLKARYYLMVERYSDALHVCTHVIEEHTLSNEEKKQLFKTKLDLYKKVNQLVRYNQTKHQYEQFLKHTTLTRPRATTMYSNELLAPLHGQITNDEPVVAIVLQLEHTHNMTYAQKLLQSCQQLHDVVYVEIIYQEVLLIMRMQSEQHIHKIIASLKAQVSDELQQTLLVGIACRTTYDEQSMEELVLCAYIEFLNERVKWERVQIENISDEQLC